MSQEQIPALQRRTVTTLMSTQVLGGIGVASGIAVAALLAAEISGADHLSGLANTAQVLGTALLTAPVVALIATRGRCIGLLLGYGLAILGAALIVLAAVLGWFLLLLAGAALFGASTTAGNQARYAAIDLAPASHRGRHLSLVVWAATIGAVAGPNLVGPGARVAERLGLPPLTGPFLLSGVGFALAALVLATYLRPDPLLTARALADAASDAAPQAASGSVRHGLSVIRGIAAARLGAAAIAAGHAVMVAVMVMTPMHMHHGHAEVEVIGFVISIHILGMFGLAPVFGYLADRFGPRAVVLAGVVLLVAACTLAGLSDTGWSLGLLAGLFLLGTGWSATMVAGSGQLAGAVPVHDRSAAQGAADIIMGLCGAAAGALAGLVVGSWGYGWLCLLAAGVALALGAYTLRPARVVSLSR